MSCHEECVKNPTYLVFINKELLSHYKLVLYENLCPIIGFSLGSEITKLNNEAQRSGGWSRREINNYKL